MGGLLCSSIQGKRPCCCRKPTAGAGNLNQRWWLTRIEKTRGVNGGMPCLHLNNHKKRKRKLELTQGPCARPELTRLAISRQSGLNPGPLCGCLLILHRCLDFVGRRSACNRIQEPGGFRALPHAPSQRRQYYRIWIEDADPFAKKDRQGGWMVVNRPLSHYPDLCSKHQHRGSVIFSAKILFMKHHH